MTLLNFILQRKNQEYTEIFFGKSLVAVMETDQTLLYLQFKTSFLLFRFQQIWKLPLQNQERTWKGHQHQNKDGTRYTSVKKTELVGTKGVGVGL